MARKKTAVDPPTKAVKIDRALATKAQMIATDQGIPLAEYLSAALRAAIDRDWSRMVRKLGPDSKP
jgi:hypothetical protein